MGRPDYSSRSYAKLRDWAALVRPVYSENIYLTGAELLYTYRTVENPTYIESEANPYGSTKYATASNIWLNP